METRLPGLRLLFRVLAFLVGSWILAHFLSIFGIFAAVTLPIWWLLAPKRVPCFLCKARKEGEECPFCRRKVVQGEYSPKNLLSVLLNSSLVVVFTVLSVGVVYVESKIILGYGLSITPRTATFDVPEEGSYMMGEIFPMEINVQSAEVPINLVQADLKFDPDYLEAVEIDPKDSFCSILVQKEVDNDAGFVRYSGGLPNPGYTSEESSKFTTVYFMGKQPGVTRVEFMPSSMVLANDGEGTNILKEVATATFFIVPEELSEEEKSIQEVEMEAILGEAGNEDRLEYFDRTASVEVEGAKLLALRSPENVLGETTSIPEEESGPFSLITNAIGWFDEKVLRVWRDALMGIFRGK